MTIRIVRDAPRAALAVAATVLAYLAWTDFGRLFSSLRGTPEWVLAVLFGAAAAATGRTTLGIGALAAGFAVVPGLLGGRLHLAAMGCPVVFGMACLAVDRAPYGVRPYVLCALAAGLALVVSGSTASGLGPAVLGTTAALPAVWILFRSDGASAPALFLAKLSAVLLVQEILRSTVLPWNGVRGLVFWVLLTAGTTGAAAAMRAISKATAALDRFSCLAISTGGLLILAVGRRLHDPESARNLLLMGTIATEFVFFIFLGVDHLRRDPERPVLKACAVPLLDRREDVALEHRLAE